MIADDSWMSISEQELDSILQQAAPSPSKPHQPADSAENPSSDSADLMSMAYGMKSFIDKVSAHSGAEFPW